jgi:hypothetical protein
LAAGFRFAGFRFAAFGFAAFVRPDERLAPATRMLSTRLGQRRPARFAARRAFDLSAELRRVCRPPLGADFFHGAFRLADLLEVLVMPESRSGWTAKR